MAADLPAEQFDVVLADPAWSYYGQQDKWSAAAKFYPTMTEEEISALPVRDLLFKHSVLFMWATSSKLDVALRVLHSWGLHFRGVAFTWVKTTQAGKPIGAQGVRPSIIKPTCEFVLCGSPTAKGRPMPIADESIVHSVLAPVREHSRKPDEVMDRIERLYPDARRLEMFARQSRVGWSAWGNEVGKFNGDP